MHMHKHGVSTDIFIPQLVTQQHATCEPVKLHDVQTYGPAFETLCCKHKVFAWHAKHHTLAYIFYPWCRRHNKQATYLNTIQTATIVLKLNQYFPTARGHQDAERAP
jgi:hypothetical protein